MIECFANSPLNYQYNVFLDGTQSWTVNTIISTLDYDLVYDSSNVLMSQVNSIISVTNSNLPNPNNFSLTISANAYQTQTFMVNSIDPNERVMIIQTVFVGNTTGILHANNITLRVKNSSI